MADPVASLEVCAHLGLVEVRLWMPFGVRWLPGRVGWFTQKVVIGPDGSPIRPKGMHYNLDPTWVLLSERTVA